MKLGIGRRILLFLHWLMSLFFCAGFVVQLIAPEWVARVRGGAEYSFDVLVLHIVGIVLLTLYAILVICQALYIFRRRTRTERGFITVDSSDTGRIRITIPAIEQLVRQSVDTIEGITDMKIDISNQDDAIAIAVNATIASGSHVPTITMNMQRAIRQYVEMNCGVAVRSVSISINSVSNEKESSRRRRGKGDHTSAPKPAGSPDAAGVTEETEKQEPYIGVTNGTVFVDPNPPYGSGKT